MLVWKFYKTKCNIGKQIPSIIICIIYSKNILMFLGSAGSGLKLPLINNLFFEFFRKRFPLL